MEKSNGVNRPLPTVTSTEFIGPDLSISRRNLPHWQLGGSTYFVTFRVKEGIILSPEERAMVLQACLYGNNDTGEGACATNGTKDNETGMGATDRGKTRKDRETGEDITGRGKTGEGACSTRWRLHAAIAMPDHMHLLLTPAEVQSGRWIPLSQIMQGIKGTTSHRINKRRGRAGPLWQDESYDRIIRDEEEFNSKLKYICGNAVKADLVDDEPSYPFFWCEGSNDRNRV